MTEWEKAQAGYLYDANYEPELIALRTKCADLCWEFNMCRPSDTERQQKTAPCNPWRDQGQHHGYRPVLLRLWREYLCR